MFSARFKKTATEKYPYAVVAQPGTAPVLNKLKPTGFLTDIPVQIRATAYIFSQHYLVLKKKKVKKRKNLGFIVARSNSLVMRDRFHLARVLGKGTVGMLLQPHYMMVVAALLFRQ